MAQERTVLVELTTDERALLCTALDSHEYWQLGYDLPRNDGLVFVPGDSVSGEDPYWEGRRPSTEQRGAISQIVEARVLKQRLTAGLTRFGAKSSPLTQPSNSR